MPGRPEPPGSKGRGEQSVPVGAGSVFASSTGVSQPVGVASATDAAPSAAAVVLEPDAPLGAAPQVLRFHLTGFTGEPLTDLWLFRDTLSAYHLGRIQKHELPSTLVERQLPVRAWHNAESTVVAPLQPLEPKARYSLASPGRGLIAEITVAPASDQSPLLKRFWPPRELEGAAGCALFCGDPRSSGADGALPHLRVAETPLELEPGRVPAQLSPGLDGFGTEAEQCATLCVEADAVAGSGALSEPGIPPPRVAGLAIEPLLLALPSSGHASPVPDCKAAEVPLGPGCLSSGSDRVTVCSPGEPRLWVLRAGEQSVRAILENGGCSVLTGLTPDLEYALHATTVDSTGFAESLTDTVRTELPKPEVIISELMANPLGPEPAQEWVELYNDGTAAADLHEYLLADGGGKVELPGYSLAPGAYVLLVSSAFDSARTEDILPAPDTPLLRLPSLGKGGLSNSGEIISLLDPTGQPISQFPALASKTAGVSLARRFPRVAGDGPEAFGPSSPPGASPGKPNSVVPVAKP